MSMSSSLTTTIDLQSTVLYK